jgi:hypothetical protein
MLPLLPLMMENCAECTYPISEDISMGLMFAGTHTCSWRWCGLLCVTYAWCSTAGAGVRCCAFLHRFGVNSVEGSDMLT